MMSGNDDNPHVSVETFNQFKIDQASLCKAYRSHLETKIESVEDNIKGHLNAVGLVLGIIVSICTLIMLVWK